MRSLKGLIMNNDQSSRTKINSEGVLHDTQEEMPIAAKTPDEVSSSRRKKEVLLLYYIFETVPSRIPLLMAHMNDGRICSQLSVSRV